MDIISCASTRSSPFLQLNHIFLLERAEIGLEYLTGCMNWAMVFILEISLLDTWRREAEKAHKLSIVELTNRGSQIEERLRGRLANIENQPSTGISLERTLEPPCVQITRIFALSALTYLHVVISGPYPELPEITESVSKTIDAFQSLTDPKLLRQLVWPFCVSGCLALDKQHDIFRQLVSAAEITPSTVGTCFEAFKVIEECWETRTRCSSGCDWATIMNQRGHYILLA